MHNERAAMHKERAANRKAAFDAFGAKMAAERAAKATLKAGKAYLPGVEYNRKHAKANAVTAAADRAEAEARARARVIVNERLEFLMDEVIGQGTNGVVGAESVEANKETELLDDLSQQIRGTKTTDWLKKTVNQFRRIHHARRRDKDFADATESQYNILRTDFIVKWHTMYYGLMGFLPVPYNQDRETLRHADLDRTCGNNQAETFPGAVSMSCYENLLESSRIRWMRMIADDQQDRESHVQWRKMISPPSDGHIMFRVSKSVVHRQSPFSFPTHAYVRHRLYRPPNEDKAGILLQSVILSSTLFTPMAYVKEYGYFLHPDLSYNRVLYPDQWKPLCNTLYKYWEEQEKVAKSYEVLVDSTFNTDLDELEAKVPPKDSDPTAMTSDELQNLFDDGITGVNQRSRSFGQPPTSVLNKMRENMAEEHSSNEQPDDQFLQGLRHDIAQWEVKDEIDKSREIPSDADITPEAGTPNDAMSSPKNNVPVKAKKGNRLKW
ncbi:hypothetical protein FPSE_10570 [Fusarium pseudograminearum CS3096]|uniref:Uncharacterized protein n=1 Tax=Fusarium pseudograminearum (strain CS3096) TaxID=1028729 RepID=K3V752_FUSPC|nr:hypothetical protein FPSE_10570 [Fusarium pseudograminearum CS3096]EKJ69232.1 hypothetical protein FPSE_10570 [Fusarium pseudograminearum CS3096]